MLDEVYGDRRETRLRIETFFVKKSVSHYPVSQVQHRKNYDISRQFVTVGATYKVIPSVRSQFSIIMELLLIVVKNIKNFFPWAILESRTTIYEYRTERVEIIALYSLVSFSL